MSWRLRSFLVAFGLLVAPVAPVLGQRPVPNEEYRLKAAIVHRLPQFVDWPTAALSGRDAFEICVAEPNTLSSVLDELTAGELLNDRRIEIRSVSLDQDIASCHVLFIPSRANEKILARAVSLPILTIGEKADFLDEGGIISLHLVDRKVRFEIDAKAASRAGLTISSQLMRLASNVRGPR
jgi:hypothetical protein